MLVCRDVAVRHRLEQKLLSSFLERLFVQWSLFSSSLLQQSATTVDWNRASMCDDSRPRLPLVGTSAFPYQSACLCRHSHRPPRCSMPNSVSGRDVPLYMSINIHRNRANENRSEHVRSGTPRSKTGDPHRTLYKIPYI